MQEHMEDDTKEIKDSKDEKVDGKIKEYVDETFMLDFLALNSFSKMDKNMEKGAKKELSEKILNAMLQKLVDINALDKEELEQLVDKYYSVIKEKSVVNDKEIHQRFNKAINNYISKIENINFE